MKSMNKYDEVVGGFLYEVTPDERLALMTASARDNVLPTIECNGILYGSFQNVDAAVRKLLCENRMDVALWTTVWIPGGVPYIGIRGENTV